MMLKKRKSQSFEKKNDPKKIRNLSMKPKAAAEEIFESNKTEVDDMDSMIG